MPRRETGESSQPTATEQVEQRQIASRHEIQTMRDVVRHHHAFSAALEPDTSSSVETGSATLERRGEKRSAQQALLTAPCTAPELVLKAPCLPEEEKSGSISLRSLRMRAHYLLETGPFSSEAKEKHKAAMKRPEVKEKHKAALNRPEVKEKRQATMNRPEVKEKHKAAMKAALNRPEVQAARVASLKATLEKQKQEGTGRYAPEAKEKHKAALKVALKRPEVKEKRQEAYLDKLVKARTDVFVPEEIATANSTASQAIGDGKSSAWMKAGKPTSQA